MWKLLNMIPVLCIMVACAIYLVSGGCVTRFVEQLHAIVWEMTEKGRISKV